MKRAMSVLLSMVLLFCMFTSLSQSAAAADGTTIVYVTDSGTKYHRAGCAYLKKSSIPISLSDAIAQGYTPCSKCNAPTKDNSTAANTPAPTAAPVPSATTSAEPAVPGLNNFKRTNTYSAGQFKDVPSNAWYAENVKTAYELGLVKGVSATSFSPNGNVTIAETIVLASRLHSIYYSDVSSFKQGSPWYQVYVDYAIKNGIITGDDFTDYGAKATRAQFASVLANALPDSALRIINNVTSIPDVPDSSSYATAVYKLYNAGVLTGNDKYGTFAPESNIMRCAVAAIVTRMADETSRQSVTLTVQP